MGAHRGIRMDQVSLTLVIRMAAGRNCPVGTKKHPPAPEIRDRGGWKFQLDGLPAWQPVVDTHAVLLPLLCEVRVLPPTIR